jgi:hypothetical protein
MNTKIFFTLIFLLLLSAVKPSAQIVLRSELNLPRTGDVIVKQQVEWKNPGREGQNVVWDFSSLQAVNDEYSIEYSEPPLLGDTIFVMGLDSLSSDSLRALITSTEHYTMYYQMFDGNRLWTLGHENPTNLLHYTEPLLSGVFPLAFGDKDAQNYVAEGFYSSTDSVSTCGNVKIEADAEGMLLLPSGDTVKNVLRVKTVQRIENKIKVADNIGDTIFVSRDTVVVSHLRNYKWYAKGYRYPVFETVQIRENRDAQNEREIFGTSFFYPPQEHFYLETDEENLAVLDSLENANADPWAGLLYNYFPNPVKTYLDVELFLPRDANVIIKIHSQTGITMLNENKGYFSEGLHHIRINLPSLAVGNYTLNILLNEHLVSGTIFKR